jgi:hypothetical protein
VSSARICSVAASTASSQGNSLRSKNSTLGISGKYMNVGCEVKRVRSPVRSWMHFSTRR